MTKPSKQQQSSIKTPDELGLELLNFISGKTYAQNFHGNYPHSTSAPNPFIVEAINKIQDLIQQGANPNFLRKYKNSDEGIFISELCLQNIGPEATSLIIAAPGFEPNNKNIHGQTLAMVAAESYHVGIIDQLFTISSFNPDIQDKSGATFKSILKRRKSDLKSYWKFAQEQTVDATKKAQIILEPAKRAKRSEAKCKKEYVEFEKSIAKYSI